MRQHQISEPGLIHETIHDSYCPIQVNIQIPQGGGNIFPGMNLWYKFVNDCIERKLRESMSKFDNLMNEYLPGS